MVIKKKKTKFLIFDNTFFFLILVDDMYDFFHLTVFKAYVYVCVCADIYLSYLSIIFKLVKNNLLVSNTLVKFHSSH